MFRFAKGCYEGYHLLSLLRQVSIISSTADPIAGAPINRIELDIQTVK
jgi:hypothetical protein